MKKHITFLIIFLFTIYTIAQQYGGMWIPTELNEKEMKDLGMKISAKDIWNTEKPSIKDAVVQFNGGCTAEIISPKGLLLTNHHCGYSEIQSHSTIENDYLTDGFWAKNTNSELPNPGVTVDFIVQIKDVTNEILSNTKNVSADEIEKVIKNNIATTTTSFKTEDYQKVIIKPMYYGNKYYAYVIETYKDIRLVGAPPSSIGKYGSDTDNWVWPRHTGDFSMFRIYADKNNKPAEYSPENVPYKPKHFLPISIKNKNENDFTLVYGFPGRTTEYLPSIAIQKVMTDIDPARISVREVALKTLDEKMRTDKATKIKYASKYASIANYWKKWIGEVEGLEKSNAVEKRKNYENQLTNKNPKIKSVLDQLNKLYEAQAPYAINNAYFGEVMRNAETLRFAKYFKDYVEAKDAGKMTPELQKRYVNFLSGMYKDYSGELDAKVTAKVLALYQKNNDARFLPDQFSEFENEKLNIENLEKWSLNSIISGRGNLNGKTMHNDLEGVLNDKDFTETIKNDPFFILTNNLQNAYNKNVENKYQEYQKQIDILQKEYMALLLSTDKERKFFPDANSTLRVTYGQVKGSNPRDAVYYGYKTNLSGVMEKYIPGDYEFDVPSKLIQLYNTKDYGIYKDASGEIPVNFTATNHTTGGNSGSPALDANGNLIGLNFDRQWEGTMSDINFDPRFSRNIMVDTNYILFIIDKYADAKWLIQEMKIIK